MKNSILILLFSLTVVSIFLLLQPKNNEKLDLPAPTEIVGDENEDNAKNRQAWFEMMHRSAETTNWEAMEYQNQMNLHHKRVNLREQVQMRGGDPVEINGGQLIGTWKERGSLNQAGSVIDTEFDPVTEEIWLVSAGGSIFKGSITGNDWVVINQDIKFNGGLLKFIPHNGSRRLLAMSGKVPHYSDDDGLTWTSSTGIPVDDRWANFRHPVVLEDSLNSIYVLSKPSYWEDVWLYRSVDHGETFSPITKMSDSDLNLYALSKPHFSNDLFLIEKNNQSTKTYQLNPNGDQISLISTSTDLDFDNSRSNLASIQIDTTLRFISYAGNGNDGYWAYRSEDKGETWEKLGQLESRPWGVGIYIVPSHPNLMMAGEVHCVLSYNDGNSWARKNNWGAYYGDVEHQLHADIMYMAEFQRSNGENFILISNHGGLNISHDNMVNIDNLGLQNLNVSQYYSVRTDPRDPFYIYAGTQDQGFQIANTATQNDLVNFDQVISGDYGHTVFSSNGKHLWTVYPGGWVSYYPTPYTGQYTAGWTVDSDDESVWIPPLMESPDQSMNEIYIAGGNANGGPGSHLIKLTHQTGNIIADQLAFDFKDESGGGELSAMTFSPINPENWYAATTNGRFFYSNDSGQNWEQSVTFVPGGHYLYGQAIYASKLDPNTVYLAGSGYDNPPVYKSTDGGINFFAVNDGLPNTLIFELASDLNENLIFAATEAGPFVYFVHEEMWYDLSGLDAPNQTYWSVEFVEDFNLIRYGTYGRGIWDFNIEEFTATSALKIKTSQLEVSPNPTSGTINITIGENEELDSRIEIFNIQGQLIDTKIINSHASIIEMDLKNYGKGTYFIKLRNDKTLKTAKVMVQ